MKTRTPPSKIPAKYKVLNDILLREWHPVGLKMGVPEDEYLDYAVYLSRLIDKEGSLDHLPHVVAEHLLCILAQYFEMNPGYRPLGQIEISHELLVAFSIKYSLDWPASTELN